MQAYVCVCVCVCVCERAYIYIYIYIYIQLHTLFCCTHCSVIANIAYYFYNTGIFLNQTSINPLTPNDRYSGRTAPLTSKRYIIYIYSTNIGTEYLKHCVYSPFFSLQNAVCFIILTYLVPVLFTFYIQSVLKFKK